MNVKFLDKTGLGYFLGKIKAWCNSTFAAITHNQASNTINVMTGYSKPNSGSAIAASDSLNSAVGKLEAKVDSITAPTIPNLSKTISGSGNAITDITVSGHAITATKGSTFSLANHTHNNLLSAGDNVASTSTNTYASGYFNVRWFSQADKVPGQPSQYGFLTTFATGDNSSEVHQIWCTQNNGDLYHRGTNGSSYTSPPAFKKLIDSSNETQLSLTNSGSGNAVTGISVSGHSITATKGSTFLTSHQDISGKVNKSGDTMTGNLTLTNECKIFLKQTGITRGTTTSAKYPFVVQITDNANKTLGGLYYEYLADKTAKTHLMCYQGTTNANTWSSIGVGYDSSGNVYTWAPTPATADNSTKIATTAFVKAQGYTTATGHTHSYLPLSGGTLTGDLVITTSSANQIRLRQGNYSILLRNDGGSFYILQTASGDPLGSWNAARPFYINLSSGLCYINGRVPDPIPVGSIIYHASKTVPTNFLICNGGAVSRTTYAALFNVIGTTYGAGNGSSTFNVPNLIDRFPQGNATPGTVKAAGLPNITGGFGDVCANGSLGSYFNIGWSTGAFYQQADGHNGWRDAWVNDYNTNGFHNVDFSASRSSSIYGNSSTVQPPALTLVPCIRYA